MHFAPGAVYSRACVVVVYYITIVAMGHGLSKKFRPMRSMHYCHIKSLIDRL